MTAPDICRTCRIHDRCHLQAVCGRVKRHKEGRAAADLQSYANNRYWKIQRQMNRRKR